MNLLTVGQQVLILFLLMGIGGVCRKTNLINEAGIKSITNVVLYFVTPCVIINAFQREFNKEVAYNLLIVAAIALCTFIASIVIASIAFPKGTKNEPVYRMATVLSNCGFMSLPLQQALVGDIGVFYGAVYVAMFNIIVWTWGVYTMSPEKKNALSVKKILFNPGIIGVVVGSVLFFTGTTLVNIINTPVGYLAALNTPLPMIVIGCYLSELHLKDFVSDRKQYVALGLRLIVFPVLLIGVLKALNVGGDIRTVCVIATSAPVAAMTTMFSTRFNQDAKLASRMVSVSTLLSMITMPLIISFSQTI